MMGAEILTLLAEQTQPGSVMVPLWLRFGVIIYGVLLVAALMIYAQTKHQRPWSVIWALIIAFIPILGAVVYFIAQTVAYRRSGERHTKGRAETMAPEEYQQQEQHDGDRGSAGPDAGPARPSGPSAGPSGR